MADFSDLVAATRAVVDPSTSASDLAQIAQLQPSLRPQVAAHPNVYPALLAWLNSNGDPATRQAVTDRIGALQAVLPSPPMTQASQIVPGSTPIARRSLRPFVIGGIVLVVLVAVTVTLLVMRPWARSASTMTYVVPSAAMENTLQVGDQITVSETTQFARGDIIVFSDPGGWLQGTASPGQQYIVERLVGLPGDRVQCCSNGQLTINGTSIDESSYLKDPTQAASAFLFDVTVPTDRVFVLGDNRADSADSRWHLCEADPQGMGMNGFIPLTDVVGTVQSVMSPANRAGQIAAPTKVFAQVPPGADPPPDTAKVSVSAGGPNGPCGNG